MPAPSKLSQRHSPRQTCSDACANRLRIGLLVRNVASKHDAKFVAKFRLMWERGDTVKAMSAALYVSKDVICGLRFRLKLPKRASPIRHAPTGNAKRPYRSRAKAPRTAAGFAALVEAQRIQTLPQDPPPKPLRMRPRRVFTPPKTPNLPHLSVTTPEQAASGVAALDLERGACHFPLTNCRPWRFCGEAASVGCYCANHALRCSSPRNAAHATAGL